MNNSVKLIILILNSKILTKKLVRKIRIKRIQLNKFRNKLVLSRIKLNNQLLNLKKPLMKMMRTKIQKVIKIMMIPNIFNLLQRLPINKVLKKIKVLMMIQIHKKLFKKNQKIDQKGKNTIVKKN